MSIKLMTTVWENGPEEHGQLLVLLALADWAGADGTCWPSTESIGRRARMTRRNAQKNLRLLEEAGYITTMPQSGPHGCNLYRINEGALDGGRHKDTGASPETQGGVAGDAKGETPATPEPSLNLYSVPSERATSVAEALPLAGEEEDEMKTVLWSRGIAFLSRTGTPEAKARSMLGKWLRDHDAGVVLAAFSDARRNAAVDPVPYLCKVLQKQKRGEIDYGF